jgi:hypothetical protein
MILAELRGCPAEHGRVSLADMANRLDIDPDVLSGMPATLERMGRVRKLCADAVLGRGCATCDHAATDVYDWLGRRVRPVVSQRQDAEPADRGPRPGRPRRHDREARRCTRIPSTRGNTPTSTSPAPS